MRTRVLAVLAVMLFPVLSYGQTVLTFPRVVQLQDFSRTGFALVNPSSTDAAAELTLIDTNGKTQATARPVIPKRGQLARLASELFPGAGTSGWVQVTSPTSGLQGFWFGGDFATYADGAEAATSSAALVIPLITSNSEIHLVNTGGTEITVLVDLLDVDGFDLDMPYPKSIPPKGALTGSVASLFPGIDLSTADHMRVRCQCPDTSSIAATAISWDFLAAPSWSVVNGVPAATTARTLYFATLIDGPQPNANWKSTIGLTNLGTAANQVSIELFSESGQLIAARNRTLAPKGGLRVPARELFQLSDGFHRGWVRATSSSGLPLAGYIAYADSIAAGVAVVPAQQEGSRNLLFSHIADLPPWLTGIAIDNPNSEAAAMDVYVITPAGALIGHATVSVPAMGNVAKLLSELIPETQSRTSDGGFVYVTSTVPVHGVQLFFSRNLRVLANVGAAKLSPGIAFEPPQ